MRTGTSHQSPPSQNNSFFSSTSLLVSVTLIVFAAGFFDYGFHDDYWMSTWGSTGELTGCANSPLFWESYFLDGRFFAAFVADCILKPLIHAGDHDYNSYSTLLQVFRFVNICFIFAYIYSLRTLANTLGVPKTTSASLLACFVLLPGILFLAAWAHFIVFSLIFLCAAAQILFINYTYKNCEAKSSVHLFLSVFFTTMIVGVLGYGSYTVTAMLPLAIISLICFADHENINKKQLLNISCAIVFGLGVSLIVCANFQKFAIYQYSHFYPDYVENVRHSRVNKVSFSQLETHLSFMFVSLRDHVHSFQRIADLWYIDAFWPEKIPLRAGYHEAIHDVSKWIFRGVMSFWLLFYPIYLIFHALGFLRVKERIWTIVSSNQRELSLIICLIFSLGVVVVGQLAHYRAVFIFQFVYLCAGVFAFTKVIQIIQRFFQPLRFLVQNFTNIFIMLLIIVQTSVLANMIWIPASVERGVLGTIAQLYLTGNAEKIRVNWPDTIVWPDSFGPSLMFNERPADIVRLMLKTNQQLEFPNKGSFAFEYKHLSHFSLGKSEGQKIVQITPGEFIGNVYLTEDSAMPPIAISQKVADKTVDLDCLTFGGCIWHNNNLEIKTPEIVIIPNVQTQIPRLYFTRQPGHYDRAPKKIGFQGFADGEKIFSGKTTVECSSSQKHATIRLGETYPKVDKLILSVLENCGDKSLTAVSALNNKAP